MAKSGRLVVYILREGDQTYGPFAGWRDEVEHEEGVVFIERAPTSDELARMLDREMESWNHHELSRVHGGLLALLRESGVGEEAVGVVMQRLARNGGVLGLN